MTPTGQHRDVVVIGGGQAGLAAGFYLRRHGIDFAILDAQHTPGGAWPHMWESLRLFSPAQFSSLPGWQMPMTDGYPDAAHVIDYLTRYEQRYQLPIHRGITVAGVHRTDTGFQLNTNGGGWTARVVVSATGTWWQPFIPALARNSAFTGRQLHTVQYGKPQDFTGLRVAVVGAGNSGAQIAADLTRHAAAARWITHKTPRFLPDDVDGRVLFQLANQRYRALKAGLPTPPGIRELGDVVAIPPVRHARDRGQLHTMPMFTRLGPDGHSGPTAAPGRVKSSSGPPASGPPCTTSPRYGYSARTGIRSPTAPPTGTTRICTCSATATGPGLLPPP